MLGRVKRGLPKVRPQDVAKSWKIVRGDTVQVVAGKDKGKQGTVVKVVRKDNALVVEGCNLVKRHVKPFQGQPGGIATKESPLHVSNVSLIDPVTKLPTRVSVRYLEDGSRVRVCRKTGNVIPRPEVLLVRKRAKGQDSDKDTAPSDVLLQTYVPPVYQSAAEAGQPAASQ